jgi:hypothetical protein
MVMVKSQIVHTTSLKRSVIKGVIKLVQKLRKWKRKSLAVRLRKTVDVVTAKIVNVKTVKTVKIAKIVTATKVDVIAKTKVLVSARIVMLKMAAVPVEVKEKVAVVKRKAVEASI